MLHLIHFASETTIDLLVTHQILVEAPVTREPKGTLGTSMNRACMRCSEAHTLQERFGWRLSPQEISKVMQRALPVPHLD